MEGGAETHGASLEGGEETPLLRLNNSSRQRDDGVVSFEDDGRRSTSGWRAPAIVLGFKSLESVAYYAVQANLVIYLSSIFHETSAASATDASTWAGTTYFTPLVLGIAADAWLGSYLTVLIFTLVYLLGMIILTLSAFLPSLMPPPCRGSLCPSATAAQKLVFFCGIYLVAFGCGSAKSCLVPLGADQFYDENPIDRERRATFFSLYYVCITVGNLVASTLVVWVQVNVSWAFGYGLGALCLALGLGGLLLGAPVFRLVRPSGSPLKSVVQVLVASFRKMHLDVSSDGILLYAVNNKSIAEGAQQLVHTDSFRFLDKAAIVSDSDMSNVDESRNNWILCTVTQVEELKILLRLIPIWISCVTYAAAHSQMYTTFVEQGRTMNTRIGGFSIPPASLTAFEVVCVICLAVFCNKILIPMTRSYTRNRKGFSQLQRMGIGRVLMIITMAVAAILEAKRLQSSRVGESLSILCQLPQFFLLACSEVFSYVSQLEFFYDQAPSTMKSMCTSFSALSLSLGNYLNSLIILLIELLTTKGGQKPGWLPEDLNEGHLDYLFWIFSVLSLLNFVVYLICAEKYTLKKVVTEDENICS